MNDDLILLITFVSIEKTLDKIVLRIEHGLNNGILKNYQYFNEPEVAEEYKKLLPLHIVNFIDFIVEVEEIFDVVQIGVKNDKRRV